MPEGAFDGASDRPFRLLGAPVPDNGWTVVDPDGGLEDDSPTAPERRRFWDRLQDKAFDQICKNIKLKVGQHIDFAELLGAGAEVERSLRRYPNGKFALVDEAKASISLGWNRRVLAIPGTSGLGINLGSSIEGRSLVIRPTNSDKSCKLLGKLANVTHFKTVLPLSTKRLAAMREGELWKLPLRLTVGAGLGVGAVLQDSFPVSISFGTSREDRAAATLYRISPQELRFRLRLDHAVIRNRGGEIVYSFPTMTLGLPTGEGIILKEIYHQADRLAARELNRYLAASLGLSKSRREGRQLLLEFVVNPQDKEQLEALVRVIKGDLDVLGMLWKSLEETRRLLRGDRTVREEIDRMRREHSDDLGTGDSFAGVDEYSRERSRFHFQLPVLVEYERNKALDTDRMVLVDGVGGEYNVRRSAKNSESAFLDVPFLGQITKHNTQKSAKTITYTGPKGKTSSPMAVYTHQEGFLRHNESTARNMVKEANEVIKFAGVRGEGVNEDTTLPVDALFPEPERKPRRGGPHRRPGGADDGKTYKRGVMVFTVAFSMQAVRDILYAPADLVLRAFANTLKGEKAKMMRDILLRGELKGESLDVDAGDVVRAAGHGIWDEDYQQTVQSVRSLAQTARAILADLARARQAADPQAQSKLLLELLSGKGAAKLAYDKIVKVLIQLTDAKNIWAEFYVKVDKKVKGEEDTDARYLLNKDRPDNELLRGASRAVSRFAEPSQLSD